MAVIERWPLPKVLLQTAWTISFGSQKRNGMHILHRPLQWLGQYSSTNNETIVS